MSEFNELLAYTQAVQRAALYADQDAPKAATRWAKSVAAERGWRLLEVFEKENEETAQKDQVS